MFLSAETMPVTIEDALIASYGQPRDLAHKRLRWQFYALPSAGSNERWRNLFRETGLFQITRIVTNVPI